MSKNALSGLGIVPLLTAAVGAYSAIKGAGGKSGSALPPGANPSAPAAPGGNPAFQQSFTPQMSPNFIVGSTVSGDVRAITSQVAPGGQRATSGPAANNSGTTPALPGQQPLADAQQFDIENYTPKSGIFDPGTLQGTDWAKLILFSSLGLAALLFVTKK